MVGQHNSVKCVLCKVGPDQLGPHRPVGPDQLWPHRLGAG